MGIVYNTAVSSPVPFSPQQNIPSTPVTAFHVTRGTNPPNPEVWTRGWIYGRQTCLKYCVLLCYYLHSTEPSV